MLLGAWNLQEVFIQVFSILQIRLRLLEIHPGTWSWNPEVTRNPIWQKYIKISKTHHVGFDPHVLVGNTENWIFLTAQLQVSVKTKNQPENKPKTQGPSWPHPAETPEPNRSAPQPPASASPKRKPHPSWSDHRPSATWVEAKIGNYGKCCESWGYPVTSNKIRKWDEVG